MTAEEILQEVANENSFRTEWKTIALIAMKRYGKQEYQRGSLTQPQLPYIPISAACDRKYPTMKTTL